MRKHGVRIWSASRLNSTKGSGRRVRAFAKRPGPALRQLGVHSRMQVRLRKWLDLARGFIVVWCNVSKLLGGREGRGRAQARCHSPCAEAVSRHHGCG